MFQNADNVEKLTQITKLFTDVKSIIIYAEEIALDFNTYPQVLLELRNALDHLLRAVAAELSPAEYDSNYANESLGKVYSHLFRAGYDALDWTAIELREDVIEELKGFSPQVIDKAIPTYYPTIRPQIDVISQEISDIRKAKDVASSQQNLAAFGKYLGYIQQLKEYKQTIIRAKPSLIELQRERRWGSIRFWAGTAAIGLICALVGALAAGYLGIGHSAPPPANLSNTTAGLLLLY